METMKFAKTMRNNLVRGVCAALVSIWSFGSMQNITAQSFTSRSYPTGNYIFCGKELPKGFAYIVEKEVGGKWTEIASLKTPQNLSECNARILSLPAPVATAYSATSQDIEFVWERIKLENSSLDSIYGYALNRVYQYMAGCGCFDDGITQPGTYKYRISKSTGKDQSAETQEVSLAFPPKPFNLTANPVSYQINFSGITLRYKVADLQNTSSMKIFRSPYLRKDFREIFPEKSFGEYKDEMVAVFTDKDVTLGMTYSYVAVPHDELGNLGQPTDTLQVYFVGKDADLGLIKYVNVTSMPEEQGNKIEWDFNARTYIHTVSVYRGNDYEGDYQLLTTLNPDVKEYFDTYDIEFGESYYYFILINDGLGNSIPSARFPAILEGKKENFIPPQDLEISRSGNLVTLTFRTVGRDIHGAYVYRANGYDAPLKQLPRMVFATDEIVTYTDTLPLSRHPHVYSYAVASINKSYNISPMSKRVNTAFSGGMLPIPQRLEGHSKQDAVWLVWSDVSEQNPHVSGYQIFRKSIYINPKDGQKHEEPERCVGTTDSEMNYFTDSLVMPGRDYVYRVRAMTADSLDVGGFSLPFSTYTPADHLMPPTDVFAVGCENCILLQWVMPITSGIEGVVVWRGEENKEMKPLETLKSDKESFEDTSAQKGIMYYYFLTVKYKNGMESEPSDLISAKRE
ncbi:hypothetical protein [Bacteroides pyogenes]|uniref:hypothetical protein n=1 Tax=Bacteroides pyogenes TaxID=310300 RepID=UPI001BA94978|nr:hypothetical protein [Bacteroides pyogenes]MBR8706589.1 hypothetical protein [Bacteroides pyogenes]